MADTLWSALNEADDEAFEARKDLKRARSLIRRLAKAALCSTDEATEALIAEAKDFLLEE